MDLIIKYNHLKNYIKDLGSLCVAFSGGVDSTFLLAAAHQVLENKAMAVTVRSSMYTQREFNEAKSFAESLGVKHIIMDANEYNIKEFVDNTKDRCYFCKHAIFSMIKEAATNNNILYVADGSNIDDNDDFRPGMRAIKELKVVSPLKEAQLKKEEVRQLSKQMDLPTWDKPSFACLASRIPYGTKITKEKLEMVEQGEMYLIDLGFRQFRVRHHGEIARIEVLPEDRKRFFSEGLLDEVVREFKQIGFNYVTLDLEGYRTGSMNEILTEAEKKS
ncbi:ATP-dependent sacrificial sulfur transferase LarE [Petroclostridium sp. X23]|nr:ATP-dependent sacrificial sulfur transferase LarE [Petroclostridium sp. X23]WHH61695.1 ATP-dependent sacrificial sulfur transferase LarE [Petroclostridium sp. X23]